MKEEMKPITVRIPAHLLEQMREVAKHNNRSLNGEMVTALQEHSKKQQKGKQTRDETGVYVQSLPNRRTAA